MNYKKIGLIFLLIGVYTTVSFSQDKKKKVAIRLILETTENDDKVYELGNLIDQSLVQGDSALFMSYMDVDGFRMHLENNTYSLSDPINDVDYSGLLKGIGAVPAKIISQINDGSYYDFINYKYNEDDKFYSILFRLFSDETGLNYHEYRVSKSDGKFKFSDIYIYTTGENFSETLTRLLADIYSKSKKKKLFKNLDKSSLFKMKRALKLTEEGKVVQAYKIINSLKGKFTKDKYYFFIKSQIASLISDEEYVKVMEDILKKFPDDDKLALKYIDYYLTLEQYDKCNDAIEKLMSQTQDEFLYYMKGNLEFSKENYSKASEHFKFIIQNYPDYFNGYSSLIGSLTIEEKYIEAVAVLQNLVDLEYVKDELIEYVEEVDSSGYNQLEGLVKSEVFKKWKEKE